VAIFFSQWECLDNNLKEYLYLDEKKTSGITENAKASRKLSIKLIKKLQDELT
jgi:hypothetical protein